MLCLTSFAVTALSGLVLCTSLKIGLDQVLLLAQPSKQPDGLAHLSEQKQNKYYSTGSATGHIG